MNTEQVHGGIGRRIGARALDWLIVVALVVVAQVLLAVADGALLTALGVVLALVALGVAVYNQVIRVGRRGESLGKQLLGLRVLDQDRRKPIGIGRALGREAVNSLLFAACWIPGIVNLVVTAKDVRRQGWHDKAVRSLVLATAAAGSSPVQPGDRSAPEAAPRPPSLATDPMSSSGASGPTPYTPSAPPPPSTTPPPSAAVSEDDGPVEATVTSRPSTPMVGPPPSVDPPAAAATPAEETIAPEPEPEPVPEPPPAPPTPASGTPTPASGTPTPASGTPTPASGTPTPSSGTPVDSGRSTWRLTAPSGTTRTIDGPLLVGRDPDPELVSGAEVWAIDDPQLTMSKTHALLGVEDGTAWVEDWHSTNGVALHRGGAPVAIEPHTRTPLRDGDVIEFGAYKVTVEVEP